MNKSAMARHTKISSNLKHGKKIVGISDIADQAYCEKKLDLRYRCPEIQTASESAEFGTKEHEEIEKGAEPVTEEKIKDAFKRGGELQIHERRLEGSCEGVTLWGQPDFFKIRGRKAEILVEFKFSKYRGLFPSYEVQVNGYGYLLNYNGFKTEKMICCAALFPADSREKDIDHSELNHSGLLSDVKKETDRMRNHFKEGFALSCRHPFYQSACFTLYGWPFNLKKTHEYLQWLMGYWKGERKPVPTNNPNKCRSCPYNGICDSVLVQVNKNKKRRKQCLKTPSAIFRG